MRIKLILMVCAISICWNANAQSSFLQLVDKYKGQEGYSSVFISKYMFKLFADLSDDSEDKEFHEIVSNLSSMEILTAPESRSEQFYQECIDALTNDYQELMRVIEGKEQVLFLIKESNQIISELIMIAKDLDETVLISLNGNIDLEQISKLSKSMNINGMDHLEKVNKK